MFLRLTLPEWMPASVLVVLSVALYEWTHSDLYADEKSTPRRYQKLAAEMLDPVERGNGLCVHIGCGDGSLTAELARSGSWLVHGLALDDAEADQARRTLRRAGLYGRASVDRTDIHPLPYADNLVNLVVASGEWPVPKEEVLRVLAPGGVALALDSRLSTVDSFRKPRPSTMDDWTHRSHDAGGNCVSSDTAVGPLVGLRWIAGPAWPLGTGYQVSNGGTLAAGGRLFNVTLNEVTNFRKTPQERNQSWFLTARDAYNGLLLWSRPIDRAMRRDGQEFGDAIVATSDALYAVLKDELVELDPASGRTRRTFRGDVGPASALALCDGTLILAEQGIVSAFSTSTGKLLWKHEADARDLVVHNGAVYFCTDQHQELVCLALIDGKIRWRAKLGKFDGRKKRLLLAAAGIVVFVWERDWQIGHNGIAACDATTGRLLWSTEYQSLRAIWPTAVWCVDDLLWHRQGKAELVGRDMTSGEPRRSVAIQGGFCGGCVRDIATNRYLIGTRPLNFIDWRDGTGASFRGGRHGCRAGVIVANGMLYTQPHGCKCVRESLRGFLAFAPGDQTERDTGPLLKKGEAYADALGPCDASKNNEWPTFRHDAARTSSTTQRVSPNLRLLWQATVETQPLPESVLGSDWAANPLGVDLLTAPTVAGGLVYVAAKDTHQVVALDAETGKRQWSFTAGARIDTPPTVFRGRCLFGAYDGRVYCVRASDGKFAWRMRAAPNDRRIVVCGQVESAWPVVGGVLIKDERAYFVVGRSAAVDNGIHAFAVDPLTGRIHWSKRFTTAVSDILVGEDRTIRMAGGGSAGFRFDADTGEVLRERHSPGFKWDYADKIHGWWGGSNRVLDRSWHVLSVNDTASHWMRIKQGYGPHEGQLLIASTDRKRVYGYRFKYVHWSKVKDPDTEFGGELVAWEGDRVLWSCDVPATFQIEAMIAAGDVLFAAGPVDRLRRSPDGKMWAVDTATGNLIREYTLDTPPAAEGIAAAAGRLYLSMQDGRLICFGKASER